MSYEVLVPPIVQSRLQSRRGQEVELLTVHFLEGPMGGGTIRPRLVGFLDPLEKEFFEHLSAVSGFGARSALRAMVKPVVEIAAAIEAGDARVLCQLPRVGERTAQKLIAELRGKLVKFALKPAEEGQAVAADIYSQAREVMLQLGFSETETDDLLRKVIKTKPDISAPDTLVEEALRQHSP